MQELQKNLEESMEKNGDSGLSHVVVLFGGLFGILSILATGIAIYFKSFS